MGTGDPLHRLQAALGYEFVDRDLLVQALTHKSFVNENASLARQDNERLEFLGDAVLDLIVGHLLMDRFPELPEGELSVMRAQVVSEIGLTVVARELELGACLFLGKGEEQTGGRDKASLLADACEALIAALYLDGGFDRAREIVVRLFEAKIGRADSPGHVDYKTRLQERAQALYKEPPRYEVVSESGPDHAKVFEVTVLIQGARIASAKGRSKKLAEQNAARAALDAMGRDR